MGYSLREERYRYTEWREWGTGRLREAELYDLVADPGEDRNVARDPALEPVLSALAARLARDFPRRRLPDAFVPARP